MNIEEFREYCLSIKGAEECFPFDENVLAFKVMSKMFAYTDLSVSGADTRINLKCDPEKAIELRERYSNVIPGFHANKKYWNTIYINRDIADEDIRSWINHSVDEVIKKMPKKQQELYKAL